MVVFVSRYPTDSDPRICKYINACERTNVSWKAITWNRLLTSAPKDHEVHFNRYSPYGGGIRKNLVGLIGWVFFVWKNLLKDFGQYKVIHAVNLNSYIITMPFKLFGKKVILDIYDTDSYKWERRLSPTANMLILPNEYRFDLIGIDRTCIKKFLEIENIPAFVADGFVCPTGFCNKGRITLSYVGSFEKNIRGIENILRLVITDERFILHLAGSGGGLDSLVKESAEKCERIVYHGSVPYVEALQIMHKSDFIMGLYYTNLETGAPTHKYACPNKYHESLCLMRPIITSVNTFIGDRVIKGNTGYTVEDTYESLASLFDTWGSQDFEKNYVEKCKDCERIWNSKYINYGKDVLEGEYISFLQNC